jgi:predicted neuraminidase
MSPDGDLLCSWFAGEAEGTTDNVIWLARGKRDRDDWRFGEPERLSQHIDAHRNPVLAQAPDGQITLFYKVGRPISRWRTWVRRSTDGRVWSQATELVPGDLGGRGPVKNPPIVTPDGTWLAPASWESAEAPGRPAVWDSFVDISRDGGATWVASALIPVDHQAFNGAGIIQPTLWIGKDGQLVALMRSTTGVAWRAVSGDGGKTWSPAEPTQLPNNNSGLCALSRPDGTVICAHNTSGIPWGPRNELVLSVSGDDGLTWERMCVIDELPASGELFDGKDEGVVTTGRGELSYPTLIEDAGRLGGVLISYTRERQSIVIARLQL